LLKNRKRFKITNNMKKHLIPLTLILFVFTSCQTDYTDVTGKYKSEILRTERNFAEMVKKEGISKAFLDFAAADAVLQRNNTLIIGKDSIRAYLDNQTLKDVKLYWTPEFVDVARSGDLGYTYGHYFFSAVDTTGKSIEFKGVFHTVWKKQADGNWRYVWD